MTRPLPLIRLPQSFLILALMFSFGAAVISGGVAYSQGSGGAGWSGVDWRVFKWSCAAIALTVLAWRLPLVDWIGENEIADIEENELRDDLLDDRRRGLFMVRLRLLTAFVALGLGIRWLMLLRPLMRLGGVRIMPHGGLEMNAPTANGGSGAAIMGLTFGSLHILGKDWTGVELAMIIPLLLFLGWEIWKGVAHLVRLNHRPR